MRSDFNRGIPTAAENEPAHASNREHGADELAADAQGDPKKLAQILGSVAGSLVHAVVVAAQRMYGNQMVTAAFEALTGNLAAPRSKVGAKHGTDGTTGSTTGGHQRTDGTYGIGGNPTMFGGDKGDDTKGAHPLITGARGGRYGDTFGAGRLGDQHDPMGGANHKFGKGRTSAGFENHSGDASMVTGSPSSSTPAAGEPMAYPTADPKATTEPATGGGSTMRASNGDSAGALQGVASAKAGGGASHLTPNITVAVGSSGTTPKPIKTQETPREDQDAAGGPVILCRGDAHGVEHSLARQLDHSQAGGDGRGDTGNVAGGTSGKLVSTRRETVGGRDQDSDHGGAIDFNAVLAINKLVNPGRT